MDTEDIAAEVEQLRARLRQVEAREVEEGLQAQGFPSGHGDCNTEGSAGELVRALEQPAQAKKLAERDLYQLEPLKQIQEATTIRRVREVVLQRLSTL